MTTSTSRRSSSSTWSVATAAGTVSVLASTRADGDFNLDRVPPHLLDVRRRGLVDLPWTMLYERHGTDVVAVDRPGAGDRSGGDVLVTDVAGAALGVWVGDCAPIVLVRPDGGITALHAGWRGLARGIVDVACRAGRIGAGSVGYLGPVIGPCCYEFGAADLAEVARAVGAPAGAIASTTSWGSRSLDVPAVVRHALARHDVTVHEHGACTACGGHHFSRRARGESERHVVVAWRSP